MPGEAMQGAHANIQARNRDDDTAEGGMLSVIVALATVTMFLDSAKRHALIGLPYARARGKRAGKGPIFRESLANAIGVAVAFIFNVKRFHGWRFLAPEGAW